MAANHDNPRMRNDGARIDAAGDGSRPLLLLSANSAWNVVNFRMELIAALQRAGFKVAVAAPDSDETQLLEKAGVRFVRLPMRPSGTSPLQDAILFARYLRLLKKLRPAAFLGFTAKPNIYGTLAARICGVPAINNLTGLGTAFIHGTLLERLLSSLYRTALRRSQAVFFHNPDDRQLFVSRGLVAPDRATVIPGSGVDLDHFHPAPLPDDGSGLTFLFAGRLLWEKGVGEFAEAARVVNQHRPDARFQILGSLAEDRRAVPRTLLERWQADGAVEYLGTCTDIRPHIRAADCIVLPSYREGLPRVLLEAAAMARPSIASDVPGCRHAVADGATGILCEARSAEALAGAIMRMIDLPRGDREAMAAKARALAEEQFGVERVWNEYLSVLGMIERGQNQQAGVLTGAGLESGV